LWIREADIFEAARRTRENPVFLPGYKFSSDITLHHALDETLEDADFVFVAVPSVYCRRVYAQIGPHLRPGQAVVSLTKGIEKKTLMRMSEIMAEAFPGHPLGVLSGPSFAKEVAEGHPTGLVLASAETELSRRLQSLLSGLSLRVYTSRDVIGVELAGALKNIIALAAGISDALHFGHNSRASLMTRGLAEITRLGLKLGAQRPTFSGLAGIGDLVLTCTGHLSRNRQVGLEIGRGRLRDAHGRRRHPHDALGPPAGGAGVDRDADHRAGLSDSLPQEGSPQGPGRPHVAGAQGRIALRSGSILPGRLL
jgi:glycerol-3-phosphate dehydrogenase (NAD(P)+)